jgi:hypothetical protein
MKKSSLALGLALTFGCFFLTFEAFSARAADDVQTKALLSSYENVRAALAQDDLSAAQKAASELSKKASEAKNEAITKHANELAKSDSLDKAREHFKGISTEAIKMVIGKKGYFVMTCPMANADWIQINKKVENPYMGKKMLGCGQIKPGQQSSTSSSSAACTAMPCCR